MNQRIASGVTGASPIWSKIMKVALKTYADGIIDKPDNVVAELVDPLGGGKPKDEGTTRAEYYIKDTEPKEISGIYQKIKISKNQSDKRANDLEISSGQYDERDYVVFTEQDPVSSDGKNRWQEGIDEWAREQSDDRYKVPKETSDFTPPPTSTPAPTSPPQTPTPIPQPQDTSTPTPSPTNKKDKE